MPRVARRDLGSQFLHVMVQGVNKEYIFYDKEHIEYYLKIIKQYEKDYDLTIIAYCIMNNHAHFLIFTQNIENFSKFMHKVNLIYAQKYNKDKNRCGVLFRNRYKSEPIYNKKYLINCIKYIHDNPVKAGMVKKSEEYKYSSILDYINNTGKSKCKIMQDLFGKDCNYLLLFKKTYAKKFIDNEINEEILNEYISEGIKEFVDSKEIRYYEIIENRVFLKQLIYYLKENCGIKYVNIFNYLQIPKSKIDSLKIK